MNEHDSKVPSDLADRVAKELSPDERLIWLGQPRLDLAVQPAYFLLPFGIAFTGGGVIWVVAALVMAPGLVVLCGLPVMAIGAILLLSPVWLRAVARNTVYALSDRRAIVWRSHWFGRPTVVSFTASAMGQMFRWERPDGSGDLVFQVYKSDGDTITRGFKRLERVRDVEELVRATLLARR
jgi:hypothetical protein